MKQRQQQQQKYYFSLNSSKFNSVLLGVSLYFFVKFTSNFLVKTVLFYKLLFQFGDTYLND